MTEPRCKIDRNRAPDPINIHIGQRLQDRRIALGKSQQDLADAMRLPVQLIDKVEAGKVQLRLRSLLRLSRALDMPIPYFFEGLPAGLRP